MIKVSELSNSPPPTFVIEAKKVSISPIKRQTPIQNISIQSNSPSVKKWKLPLLSNSKTDETHPSSSIVELTNNTSLLVEDERSFNNTINNKISNSVSRSKSSSLPSDSKKISLPNSKAPISIQTKTKSPSTKPPKPITNVDLIKSKKNSLTILPSLNTNKPRQSNSAELPNRNATSPKKSNSQINNRLNPSDYESSFTNSFTLTDLSPPPSIPVLPTLTFSHSLASQMSLVQQYILNFKYNHTGINYIRLNRFGGLSHVRDVSYNIMTLGIPIQCVEGVFLGIMLTSPWKQVVRFPISFKSRSLEKINFDNNICQSSSSSFLSSPGKTRPASSAPSSPSTSSTSSTPSTPSHTHKHLVLAVYENGFWGSIGISRRDCLMGKPLKYNSLSSLLKEYYNSYAYIGHQLLSSTIGPPLSREYDNEDPINWKGIVIKNVTKEDEIQGEILINQFIVKHGIHTHNHIQKEKLKAEKEKSKNEKEKINSETSISDTILSVSINDKEIDKFLDEENARHEIFGTHNKESN